MFATDSLDNPELMLWREEQRAIGGLMQESGESSKILGFESFVEVYEDRFSGWFTTVAKALQSQVVGGSKRLQILEQNLAGLVVQLDHEGLYTSRSGWLELRTPSKSTSGLVSMRKRVVGTCNNPPIDATAHRTWSREWRTLTAAEPRRILATAATERNSARWSVALALGPR